MLTKFLDPKNDFAFKRVFGTEKNKDILIQFLNDILNHRYIGQISEVTFLPPAQEPEVAASKQSIVDVLCRDQSGMQYIVEMQVAESAGFEKRAQFYASKAYSSQLFKGDDYNELREVIFLAITDFVMFPKKLAIKSDHIILNKLTHAHDLEDLYFTFIELPKFSKKIAELSSMPEKWYYYLRHAPETSPADYAKLVSDAPALKRAYDELERFSWSQEELLTYEKVIKRNRDSAALLLAQFQKGEQKGKERGMKQGKEEGIAIGKEEGKEEGKAQGAEETKQSMARQMLQEGEPIEKIVRWTGLSEETIHSL